MVRPAKDVRQGIMNVYLRNPTVERGRQSMFSLFQPTVKPDNCFRKHEMLSRSIKKMERTLDSVLRSIGNPTLASDLISRSPSPTSDSVPPFPGAAETSTSADHSNRARILDRSPTPSTMEQQSQNLPQPSNSPKLHSLPDNTLNPLGLLAEASLTNTKLPAPPNYYNQNVGVASRNYFKPGMWWIYTVHENQFRLSCCGCLYSRTDDQFTIKTAVYWEADSTWNAEFCIYWRSRCFIQYVGSLP